MDKTLQWLYSAECDTGGISAWRTEDGRWHQAYPEVTGYLLSTLINWGAGDLALRCARWLLSVQNPDGSFNGLDGVPRPFDTSAIADGLFYIYDWTRELDYILAAVKATGWISGLIQPDGYLSNSPKNPNPEIYNLRASAIIGNRRELHYWRKHGLNTREQRSHYMAYALEGALRLNDATWAKQQIEMAHVKQSRLIPFFVDPDWHTSHPSYDLCATAQMGILFKKIGLDATGTYNALEHHIEANGGVPQSPDDKREIAWGAKFWLDFKEVMNG